MLTFKNETFLHKKAKLIFLKYFPFLVFEKYLPLTKQYIDIEIINKQGKFAVEIQLSQMTYQQLKLRNDRYLQQDYQPIWLLSNYAIRKSTNYLYLNDFQLMFLTNILSNIPVLYSLDFRKQKIIIYYNLIPVTRHKFYFQFKTIAINQLLERHSFQQTKTAYWLNRKDAFSSLNYEDRELLIKYQINRDS